MNSDWNSGTDPLADIEAAIARVKSDAGYVPAVYPEGFVEELLDMSRHADVSYTTTTEAKTMNTG